MTEICILGSFHFAQSDKNFASPDMQAQLESVAQGLLRFSPDAVAVEIAAHQQQAVDAAYQRFSLQDLRDETRMQTGDLGDVRMFGHLQPIRYNNEAVQIGFRLAKMQGLPTVFAIDDDSEMDEEVFTHPSPALQRAIDRMRDYIAGDRSATLAESLQFINGSQWSQYNHAVYMRANEMGSSEDYQGTLPIAQWYERNLKIFANIQRLAARYRRLFVVYGAGHLRILQDLIQGDDRLCLVDAKAYIS